eukprot:TRINITY_DN10332_c0_g1_i2.p1 TRINITY_DN10332_c0_g1~~TRINITY_DN10332_c0_g1_i2.p1  ORF type:complete len:252 (+),score=77.61 TRINITY_DN10332_c0_g1_i2:101-856(+)
MSCYIQAAAMCNMAVVSNGPIKINQRALLEKQMVGKPWKDVEEIVKKAEEEVSQSRADGENATLAGGVDEVSPKDLPKELPSDLEASAATVERYQLVGRNRARAKEKDLGSQRDLLRQKHLEEEQILQKEHLEEERQLQEEDTSRLIKKKEELEEFLARRRFEKEQQNQSIENERQTEEVKKQRVHPVDILQRRIAMDLADEREAELEEMDEANEPTWIDKLDLYMSIEKEAWREQATLTRKNVVQQQVAV